MIQISFSSFSYFRNSSTDCIKHDILSIFSRVVILKPEYYLEKAASTHSANLPSNAHTKESTKPEPVDISSSNNKTIHQQHHVEPPVENNSSSSKSGSFNNHNGGNNNRLQNERKFEGNDHSGNHSFNNNTNYNKPERNQQRHAISQVNEVPSNDAASAVFSNNAPIPQWEDFSANTKKENKNDHLSNGFMRNEFPQVG